MPRIIHHFSWNTLEIIHKYGMMFWLQQMMMVLQPLLTMRQPIHRTVYLECIYWWTVDKHSIFRWLIQWFSPKKHFNNLWWCKWTQPFENQQSCGPDNCHPCVLKEVKDRLILPLYLLFAKTLQDGLLPSSWKDATITAIHKNVTESLLVITIQ